MSINPLYSDILDVYRIITMCSADMLYHQCELFLVLLRKTWKTDTPGLNFFKTRVGSLICTDVGYMVYIPSDSPLV